MKNIILQSLSLLNFKGIKNIKIDFEDNTDILGANGTGKTTIADAFTWLLFGKDTTDRKEFEVKTLDESGIIIPMIDHEVEASLLVDNETLTLRRVLKENWVKKKGFEEREFSGNKVELYWNEVPMTITEFNRKINEVLNEQVFKMITSPTYFNSIKWQDRRGLLIDIFGEVSNEEVAKGNSAYQNLISKLTQGKTLEDYKNQISASIKKAKEDIKAIPSRIDEVFRGKPEAQDFDALEKNLLEKQNELSKVDSEITDTNKAFESKLEAHRKDKLKLNNLVSEIEIIEQNAKKEAENSLKPDTSVLDSLVKEKDAKTQEIESFENALNTLNSKKVSIIDDIRSSGSKMDDLRIKWQTENAKELTFNDNDFHCPTCKREFESGDVESKKAELLKTFSDNKQNSLVDINTQGSNLRIQKENLEKELKTIQSRIEVGESSIKTAKSELQVIVDKIDIENSNSSNNDLESVDSIIESLLSKNQEYQEKILEIDVLKSSIQEAPTVDNSELVEKRNSLISAIDDFKNKLQTKTQIEAADKRISELKQEEKTLSQQIADVEKEQFVIENFIKAKVDALEETVNSKFKFVKFKMFDQQINGGVRETCEAMVNGVPYSDVNTASKIKAGLDIINVLSEFYGITAPIFIDNRESVTEILETESQIISLIVSPKHKKLKSVSSLNVEEFQEI